MNVDIDTLADDLRRAHFRERGLGSPVVAWEYVQDYEQDRWRRDAERLIAALEAKP